MSQYLFKIYSFLTLLLTPIFASAYDIEIDGLYYDVNASELTATVTIGENQYSGDIAIPDEISVKGKNLKVISLKKAFANTSITSISIGVNIPEIRFSDLEGCDRLKSISFRDTENDMILYNLYDCDDYYAEIGIFYDLPLESIYFGRPVKLAQTSLDGGSHGFCDYSPFIYKNYWGIQKYCDTINSITFGGKCNIIPSGICDTALITSLSIGDSVTSIEEDAFKNNYYLNTINIENIERFGSIDFKSTPQSGRSLYHNGKLISEVEITEGSISENAFSGVRGIERVIIGKEVVSVNSNAFSHCDDLISVQVDGEEIEWGDNVFSDNPKLRSFIASNLNSMGENFLSNCPEIKDLSCPELKKMGDYALMNCINLKNLSCFKLSAIGNHALSGTSLYTIKLPLIKDLGDYAFAGCPELTEVILGCKTRRLGNSVFNNCNRLNSITIKSLTPPTAYNDSFDNYSYVNTTLKTPDISMEEYKATAPWSDFFDISGVALDYLEYNGCIYYKEDAIAILISVMDKNTKTLEIPDTLAINDNAISVVDFINGCFNELENLQILRIPSGFTELPEINNIKTLEEVYLNNPAVIISELYFAGLENLRKIDLGNRIIKIENYAFYKCSSLNAIVIPGSCEYIGNGAFFGCSNLGSVIFESSDKAIALGSDSYLQKTGKIIPFPNPTTVDERRTGFKNAYRKGLFSDLKIEHIIINRDIRLSKYYEREIGDAYLTGYERVFYDVVYYPPFYGLGNLKTIEIGENVTAVCRNQIECVVDAKPTTMDYVNFDKCDNIEVIISNNPNPPVGGGFSRYVYENASLFLPNGGENSYINDDLWKHFYNIYESNFIPIESISLGEEELLMDIKDEKKLNPAICPIEASIKKLVWKSSDPDIADVSEDGVVTTFSDNGESIITASSCDGSGLYASVKIMVKKGAGLDNINYGSKVALRINNGYIYIDNKPENDIVEIYNSYGQLLKSCNCSSVGYLSSGVYIIKIGQISRKVIL